MKTIIKNTMIDPIEMTCECCGSVFTYNYEDIVKHTYRDFFGGDRITRVISCPVCKHDNELGTIMVHKEEK